MIAIAGEQPDILNNQMDDADKWKKENKTKRERKKERKTKNKLQSYHETLSHSTKWEGM